MRSGSIKRSAESTPGLKMPKITIRPHQIRDARRFYEILNSPNFTYFQAKPKSIKDEREYLRKSFQKRKDGLEYNYAILLDGQVIGSVGVKVDQHRRYIGEIGYFVEDKHWGKGIAPQAVKLIEEVGFGELSLKRLEIRMQPPNGPSEQVAIKSGYQKEGHLHGALRWSDQEMRDLYLYAKVSKEK